MLIAIPLLGVLPTAVATEVFRTVRSYDPAVHWAYVPPTRAALPAVANTTWSRTAFDRHVLVRLEAASLQPAATATRATLIRRLYLDLIGLPPTPDEVDAFVRDRHPAAYERVVDRLLASPQYGQRWARPWLDAARYADSNGYQADQYREVWPFRDWVIDAFNADMPFDQFTIEQIAGDLLPEPTLAQRIATGFHRQPTCNVEAGVDPEENRVNQVIDRVNTTATVWMGSTLECAQCHDHPYDPFTQVEYYQLFAFFNNTPMEVKHTKATTFDFYGPKLEVPAAAVSSSGEPTPSTTLVMVEMESQRDTFVLKRGNFLNPERPAAADTPQVLPARTGAGADNRLGLARWLVDPDHPLTPRVAVNRWWAEFFGRGIVSSIGEFGSQGEPPTHPAVLDTLARQLVSTGWSMKRIHREIVTSATYRQSSRRSHLARGEDPHNARLARGPRVRLAAETIRDNGLAISGLLSLKHRGPPTYPPQPEGIWRHVGRNPPKYKANRGEDRFRRGIYVVWRRSAPYPGFVTFDAPDRSSCVVQRSRTNTPLQALALLNDEAYTEMAWGLASRMAGHASAIRDRPEAERLRAGLTFGFRLCVSREPTEREAEHLVDLYASQADRYAGDVAAARRLAEAMRHVGPGRWSAEVAVSEQAAWFCVANALLNLDETITKG